MSFEGSRATIIKNLSGFTARVDSSGYLYTLVDSTISATAAISGQTVAMWQGSGRNGVYLTNQSGNVLVNVSASGGHLVATQNSSGFNAVYLTTQSGNVPIPVLQPNVDGHSTNNWALVTMNALYGVDLSGVSPTQMVRLKTTHSGEAASQGGGIHRLYVDSTQAGANLRTAGIVAVSDASGGAALSTSASCIHGIVIRPISGAVNAMIHVGSSGNPPWISGGLGMDIGESRELRAHNPAFIRVFARVSGTMVSWAGVDF